MQKAYFSSKKTFESFPVRYESDIKVTHKYLIDRVEKLDKTEIKNFFIDIEVLTDELPDVNRAEKPISCISVFNNFSNSIKTFYLGNYVDDLHLLLDFISYIQEEKPDIISFWNMPFDYPYLFNRYKRLIKNRKDNLAIQLSPISDYRYTRHENILFPAGISVIDYLVWFRKFTLNKDGSYALDAVSEKHLEKKKTYNAKEVGFDILSEKIIVRNQEDVQIMADLESKYNILDYFDEIRILTKVVWEDLENNCMDEKSEILTKKGWKNIDNIKEDDLVLSLNLFNEEYEYIPIDKIHKYPYKGKMLKYEKGRIEYLVTGNHRFPMRFKRNCGAYVNTNEIVFENASEIPQQRRSYILGSKGLNQGSINYLTDEDVKLCAWIITEGHFDTKKSRINSGNIYIYQSSSKNKEKYDEIKNILDKLKLKYNQHKDKFSIKSFSVIKYRLLLKEQKRIPEIFYELPLNQRKIFLETCVKGDGHKRTEDVFCITTADRILAEQYQRLSILCGYNAYITSKDSDFFDSTKTKKFKNTKTIYYVNIHAKENYAVEHNPEWQKIVNYEGRIWCISNRNQNFIMKRNDKVMISGNSRMIDMLLLDEANKRGVVLPDKPSQDDNEEVESYTGAFREAFETGLFFNLGEYDLSSAYPYALINFCLDPMNITDKDNGLLVDGTYFKQDENALLPTIIKKLVNLKDEIKAKLNKHQADTLEYKHTLIKYNAIKSLVNSGYGVCGLRFFRLYDRRVASAIAYVVRALLKYIKNECEADNNKVIYVDTDAVFIDSKEDLTNYLNNKVQEFGKKFNKESLDIKFEREGNFESIFIVSKCRYYGYLRNNSGLHKEVKGVEAKRSDSSAYTKKFQEELFERILKKEDVNKWVEQEIKDFKNKDILDISFPVRMSKKVESYKSIPIHVRAMQYANMKAKVGERFYYTYIVPTENEEITEEKVFLDGYQLDKNMLKKEYYAYFGEKVRSTEDIPLEKRIELIESFKNMNRLSMEKVKTKGNLKNVIAFDEYNKKILDNVEIDIPKMLERNILNKWKIIKEAMENEEEKTI